MRRTVLLFFKVYIFAYCNTTYKITSVLTSLWVFHGNIYEITEACVKTCYSNEALHRCIMGNRAKGYIIRMTLIFYHFSNVFLYALERVGSRFPDSCLCWHVLFSWGEREERQFLHLYFWLHCCTVIETHFLLYAFYNHFPYMLRKATSLTVYFINFIMFDLVLM